jgi:uncharacterized glyoxalase superfamily protein PhnB
MAQEIPEGFSTVTPNLIVEGASEAIELYKNAFDAEEKDRMEIGASGKIMHSHLMIGTSSVFIADADPQHESGMATKCSFYLYVKDVDSSFAKAREAGMEEVYPIEEMFWGDRTAGVKDKYGNYWTLATHLRDVSPAEMEEGKKKFMQKYAG